MGWISNNAGLKVVSLVLATCAWFFVKGITSDSRTIDGVPLEVKAKTGLTVLQSSAATVNVTVRGTREDVRQVSRQDLSAVVDLTGDERRGPITVRRATAASRVTALSDLKSARSASIALEDDVRMVTAR